MKKKHRAAVRTLLEYIEGKDEEELNVLIAAAIKLGPDLSTRARMKMLRLMLAKQKRLAEVSTELGTTVMLQATKLALQGKKDT